MLNVYPNLSEFQLRAALSRTLTPGVQPAGFDRGVGWGVLLSRLWQAVGAVPLVPGRSCSSIRVVRFEI